MKPNPHYYEKACPRPRSSGSVHPDDNSRIGAPVGRRHGIDYPPFRASRSSEKDEARGAAQPLHQVSHLSLNTREAPSTT